ncbi:MAG: hypothetical protein AAGA58_14545, partial [Verrucomicrobiota bacterium]
MKGLSDYLRWMRAGAVLLKQYKSAILWRALNVLRRSNPAKFYFPIATSLLCFASLSKSQELEAEFQTDGNGQVVYTWEQTLGNWSYILGTENLDNWTVIDTCYNTGIPVVVETSITTPGSPPPPPPGSSTPPIPNNFELRVFDTGQSLLSWYNTNSSEPVTRLVSTPGLENLQPLPPLWLGSLQNVSGDTDTISLRLISGVWNSSFLQYGDPLPPEQVDAQARVDTFNEHFSAIKTALENGSLTTTQPVSAGPSGTSGLREFFRVVEVPYDSDRDGIDDATEGASNTSAFLADSDGDGLNDFWEEALGLDPNDPDSDDNGTPDGDEDSDGDGTVNKDDLDPVGSSSASTSLSSFDYIPVNANLYEPFQLSSGPLSFISDIFEESSYGEMLELGDDCIFFDFPQIEETSQSIEVPHFGFAGYEPDSDGIARRFRDFSFWYNWQWVVDPFTGAPQGTWIEESSRVSAKYIAGGAEQALFGGGFSTPYAVEGSEWILESWHRDEFDQVGNRITFTKSLPRLTGIPRRFGEEINLPLPDQTNGLQFTFFDGSDLPSTTVEVGMNTWVVPPILSSPVTTYSHPSTRVRTGAESYSGSSSSGTINYLVSERLTDEVTQADLFTKALSAGHLEQFGSVSTSNPGTARALIFPKKGAMNPNGGYPMSLALTTSSYRFQDTVQSGTATEDLPAPSRPPFFYTKIFAPIDDPTTSENEAETGMTWEADTWEPDVTGGYSPLSTVDPRTLLAANGPGVWFVQSGPIAPTIIPDSDRDGRLSPSDASKNMKEQGAYVVDIASATEVFKDDGAIVWVNLDRDENKFVTVGSGNNAFDLPVSDTIRFYHDGLTFEGGDSQVHEDWVIESSEQDWRNATTLPGYTPKWQAGTDIFSPLPDIYFLAISTMRGFPNGWTAHLRLPDPEDLRAFHLYAKIPDFSAGDGPETAIWGSFSNTGAPWLPSGTTQTRDAMGNVKPELAEIDITSYLNPQTNPSPQNPVIMGIEGMLYKGMRYDFDLNATLPEPGKTFDGKVEIELVLRDSAGNEKYVDRAVFSFLRLPAFPGAEGFGRWATGGRGGEVRVVTNLHSSNHLLDDKATVGSLRWALSDRTQIRPGSPKFVPRTIVFKDGGNIPIQDTLTIDRGNLTIAGQRAGGRGITIDGRNMPPRSLQETDPAVSIRNPKTFPSAPRDRFSGNNVIMRYIRSRRMEQGAPTQGPGIQQDGDALEIKSVSDVIIDHCSFSWSDDGLVDISQHEGNPNSPFVTEDNLQPEMSITFQWCMLYQALEKHSKAMLLRGKYGSRYSVHHNIFGHSSQRHPEIGIFNRAIFLAADSRGHFTDFSNNLVWNVGDKFWGNSSSNSMQSQGYLRYQFLNNYYDQGPDKASNPLYIFEVKGNDDTIYFLDNYWDGQEMTPYERVMGTAFKVLNTTNKFHSETQFLPDNALISRSELTNYAGCSLPLRDDTDELYIAERISVDGGD